MRLKSCQLEALIKRFKLFANDKLSYQKGVRVSLSNPVFCDKPAFDSTSTCSVQADSFLKS